jgi:hypothetical protein
MSESDDFLARWSRRKRQRTDKLAAEAAENAPAAAAPHAPERGADADKTLASEQPLPESREPLFDPARLPSIESISAQSDIRAFLAPGVPLELTRAALRRAWTADPKIRDFVGLADYAWDFHAPDAMAGFGPLVMTDELRREIVGMFDRSPSPANAAPAAPEKAEPSSAAQAATPAEPALRQDVVVQEQDETLAHEDRVRSSKENVAMQNQSREQRSARQSHGRALPKS